MKNEYSSPWQQPNEHLRALDAAAKEFLQHAGNQADEAFQSAKDRFEAALADLTRTITAVEARAARKARIATQKADLYVQEHPWQAMGAGAVAAGVAGVLLGWLLNRR